VNFLLGEIVERRQDQEDRRKIERFSNPPVRSHFKQLHILVTYLLVIAFSAGVFHLARGFYFFSPEAISMGVFMAILAFVLTAFMYRYRVALGDYLAKESLGSLDRAMESLAALFFVIAFLATIYSLTYFIFG